MKNLILIGLLLACAIPLSDAQTVMVGRSPAFRTAAGGGSNPPASPLANQNFEGTGYDNSETWAESGGATIDEDYTGTVLLGSQSLQISAGDFVNGATEFTLTSGLAEAWGFCLFRMVDDRDGSYINRLFNSGFTEIASIQLSSSALRVDCGTANATTVSTYSVGTTYYLWWHYLKGSGADATFECWFSSSSTKPGDGGNDHAKVTTGTSTTDLKYFYLSLSAAGGTGEILFDHTYLDDEAILSNP